MKNRLVIALSLLLLLSTFNLSKNSNSNSNSKFKIKELRIDNNKTVSSDEFRSQGRGGRGVAGAALKDEDLITTILHTSAHAYLLFFTNLGKVYRLKAHQIPTMSRTARGTAIVNLLHLSPEEEIAAVIDTRDYETKRFLVFATKQGQIKNTKFINK